MLAVNRLTPYAYFLPLYLFRFIHGKTFFDVADFLCQRLRRTLTRLHHKSKTLPESFRVANHAGIVARVLMKAAKGRCHAVRCSFQVSLEARNLLLRFFPRLVFSF